MLELIMLELIMLELTMFEFVKVRRGMIGVVIRVWYHLIILIVFEQVVLGACVFHEYVKMICLIYIEYLRDSIFVYHIKHSRDTRSKRVVLKEYATIHEKNHT